MNATTSSAGRSCLAVVSRLGAVLAALALVSAACGVDGETTASPDGVDGDAGAVANPFEVGWVPDDYRLVAIGSGTEEPAWDPEMGADEPFTVFEVDGVRFTATAAVWEPMESQFQWASRSGDHSPELFTLPDGRNAAFGEGQPHPSEPAVTAPNDLVVEVDRGTALVVAAEGVDKATLVEVAEHIDGGVRADAAPVVADPPDSWELLGSVQPDALVARRALVMARTSQIPGPASAYSIGFERSGVQMTDTSDFGGSTLAVMVLPGELADPAAFDGERFVDVDGTVSPPRRLQVDGRDAYVFDGYANFGGRTRSLFAHDDDGALVVVTTNGSHLLSDEELARVAGSVRRVDDADWDAAVLAAFGGEELAPDEGESEIARGSFGDVGWLLQTRTRTMESPAGTTEVVTVDECVKLSTLQRVCVAGGTSGEEGELRAHRATQPGFDQSGVPPFVVVTATRPEAVSARISWDGESVEVPLAPIEPAPPAGPGVAVRAGLAEVALPDSAIPVCSDQPVAPPEGSGIVPARIDVLDASGAAIGCVGMG